MVDPVTPNIGLAQPTRGSDVGTWDTPVNANSGVLDAAVGGILTVGLNNSNVVLSSAQFIYKNITFNSTLTGSVTITFPTSFVKSYEVFNTCTGSSAFTITLLSGAGQQVCCPPGEIVDVVNDGTNIKFKNLGRVGSYWDYAGSSVPNWVSGCSVAPYLNCDGTTFSSATYPTLALYLGGNTLPNSKGRTRFALDQGAGLISTAATGFSSATVGSVGGGQTTTLGTSNLPPYTPAGTNAVTVTAGTLGNPFGLFGGGGVNTLASGGSFASGNTFGGPGGVSITSTFGGAAQGGVSAPLTNLPPAYIGGLTLIRAA